MLTVDEVTVYYGAARAVHRVSLVVRGAAVTAIVGTNGAGKSTLLRAISGLPGCTVSGSICFERQELLGLPPEEVVRLGIVHVPEGRRVFPELSVRENLDVGGYTVRDATVRNRTMSWVFDLFPVLRRKQLSRAGSLSGGEQQMLAIGRGLMAEPKLLMLDEPTLGLGPKLVQQVIDIVREIRTLGIPILLVEQNARMAMEVADRLVVMQNGEAILQGTTGEIRHSEAFLAAYVGVGGSQPRPQPGAADGV